MFNFFKKKQENTEEDIEYYRKNFDLKDVPNEKLLGFLEPDYNFVLKAYVTGEILRRMNEKERLL